jgi:DUF4097 and DUF4098 domain-containing protein YvlB
MTEKAICLLIVFLAAAALMPALAATKSEENAYECDMSPGKTVYFDLKSGAGVSIRGWDQSKVDVNYVQRGKGRMHDVNISPQKDGLMITSDMDILDETARNLDFEIRVPRKFDVHFESMGGGLKIVDVNGKFTGNTMGGGLTLHRVQGTVKLTTMGGPIEVLDSDLDGKMSTMGGTVYLKDVVGNLEATSMGGNVRYENVRARDGKLRAPGGSMDGIGAETVNITTMGGSIEVDEAPAGAWVSTMGGNIDLRNAAGFVKASTMGGDIEISVTDAWVDAKTMAGDVDVKIENGLGEGEKKGVKLASMSGDVSLALPADMPLDLDITISYTKNSSQNYKIISDFDLKIEESKDWDYSNGSPRKRIMGTARIGSGKYPVVVETVNGNIRIKKID